MAELSETTERTIAPVPRITIQAFCETGETAAMIEGAALDRRCLLYTSDAADE